MYRFAFLLCFLPTILEARPYEFRFTSEYSVLRGVNVASYPELDPLAFPELVGPITSYIILDLPSFRNIRYHSYGGAGIHYEQFPALIDAGASFPNIPFHGGPEAGVTSLSYFDRAAYKEIDLYINGDGLVEWLSFRILQDRPDVSLFKNKTVEGAQFSTFSSAYTAVGGTWTVTPLPPLAPVPAPPGAAMLLPALLSLLGAAGLGWRRRVAMTAA